MGNANNFIKMTPLVLVCQGQRNKLRQIVAYNNRFYVLTVLEARYPNQGVIRTMNSLKLVWENSFLPRPSFCWSPKFLGIPWLVTTLSQSLTLSLLSMYVNICLCVCVCVYTALLYGCQSLYLGPNLIQYDLIIGNGLICK